MTTSASLKHSLMHAWRPLEVETCTLLIKSRPCFYRCFAQTGACMDETDPDAFDFQLANEVCTALKPNMLPTSQRLQLGRA
jgi:hypothetical protein